MKQINEALCLSYIFKKIAPRIGAKVLLEPKHKNVGQITLKNGQKFYFRQNKLDLNMMGSSRVSSDKNYSNFFMKKMGYKTIPNSESFYSDSWGKKISEENRGLRQAYEHALKIGFPVIIKPNNGSQGKGVKLVHDKKDFYTHLSNVFSKFDIVLVEKYVQGQDYRLVVLDDEVISAYERIPLNVIGDGVKSIEKLLKDKQAEFIKMWRDTKIKFNDERIQEKLKMQNLTLKSVPKKEEQIFLLDNANLSTGGDAVDVIDKIHPFFKKLSVEVTRDMGLRFCGVDLMIEKGIETDKTKYWILEINSMPGLDNYLYTGKKQEKLVEDLYLKVLKALRK
jgi:D-alanine-D-alanine ligase-like ATP-grasp enzyme